MPPGQSRINFQISQVEVLSFIDRLRARDGFARRGKNIRARLLTQTRQVRDMIRMRVGKENQLHVQFVATGKSQPCRCNRHRYRRPPRPELARIPDEIGIHGHVVITRVELREAVSLIDSLRTPFALRELAKLLPARPRTGATRNSASSSKSPSRSLRIVCELDARLFCQFGIGKSANRVALFR